PTHPFPSARAGRGDARTPRAPTPRGSAVTCTLVGKVTLSRGVVSPSVVIWSNHGLFRLLRRTYRRHPAKRFRAAPSGRDPVGHRRPGRSGPPTGPRRGPDGGGHLPAAHRRGRHHRFFVGERATEETATLGTLGTTACPERCSARHLPGVVLRLVGVHPGGAVRTRQDRQCPGVHHHRGLSALPTHAHRRPAGAGGARRTGTGVAGGF